MADATQAIPAVGTFCWNELMTGNVDGARDFYAKLFGWTYEEKDMGPAGIYTLFNQGDIIDDSLGTLLNSGKVGGLLALAVLFIFLRRFRMTAIIALSNRIIDLGDTVIFLTGPFRSLTDSIVVMTIGAEYELFDTTEQRSIDEHIKRAVFHRVLGIALDLGQHGREGKPIGALLVVGDAKHVLEQSEQMILNPFKGYHEKQRNILDEQMTETVKEFSSLDGAFIIRGSGVIETAGARLKAGISEGLPSGLGARHAAAAGITANTKSIAITVSQSDGAVRVWRAGRMLASFESPGR